MESALQSIYALVFVSENSLVRLLTHFSTTHVQINYTSTSHEVIYTYFLFLKNADISIFVEIQGQLSQKYSGYPQFSLWIQLALANIIFFSMVLIWGRNRGSFYVAQHIQSNVQKSNSIHGLSLTEFGNQTKSNTCIELWVTLINPT